MKKVRITVLERTYNEKLVKAYGNPDMPRCPLNTEGQIFYTNGWQKPDGLCDNAWKSMQEYAMTLSNGGGGFYDGWMRNEHAAVISCNDGFRPVIYLLERLDEEAEHFLDENKKNSSDQGNRS